MCSTSRRTSEWCWEEQDVGVSPGITVRRGGWSTGVFSLQLVSRPCWYVAQKGYPRSFGGGTKLRTTSKFISWSHLISTSRFCSAFSGLLFILIFSWYDYTPASWGSYSYPTWGDAIGWIMTISCVAGILGTMLIMFCMAEGDLSEVSIAVSAESRQEDGMFKEARL